MSNAAALLKRIRAIEKRLEPTQAARTYEICLAEDEELCEELRSQLNPYDTLIIREYPKGYLGEDDKSTSGQVMSCWVNGPRGQKIPTIVRQYGVDISKV